MRTSFHHLLVSFSIVLLAFSACRDTMECMDIDTGDHPLLDSSVSSFSYSGDETLFFRDSAGHELQFVVRTAIIDTLFSTWIETTKWVNEGECADAMTVTSHLESLGVTIISQPLQYYISYHHFVGFILNESEPIYYDEMSAGISSGTYLPDHWGVSINYILNARGNEAYLGSIPFNGVYADQVVLNGKSFSNTHFNLKLDGSAVYFNHELGFIGFREKDDVLWVLDRIE